MGKVRTHTFNGRRYKIDIINDLDGFCEQGKIKPDDRCIAIMADPDTRNGLITILHECLHAENWSKTEKPVDRVSKEIGSLLWRLGYRRQVQP